MYDDGWFIAVNAKSLHLICTHEFKENEIDCKIILWSSPESLF